MHSLPPALARWWKKSLELSPNTAAVLHQSLQLCQATTVPVFERVCIPGKFALSFLEQVCRQFAPFPGHFGQLAFSFGCAVIRTRVPGSINDLPSDVLSRTFYRHQQHRNNVSRKPWLTSERIYLPSRTSHVDGVSPAPSRASYAL